MVLVWVDSTVAKELTVRTVVKSKSELEIVTYVLMPLEMSVRVTENPLLDITSVIVVE